MPTQSQIIHTLESLQHLAETEQGREELNQILGTLLGWQNIRVCSCGVKLTGTHPVHAPNHPQHLPRWDKDLNACQEVWLKLTREQKLHFRTVLSQVVATINEFTDPTFHETASALQRTLALILTLQPTS